MFKISAKRERFLLIITIMLAVLNTSCSTDSGDKINLDGDFKFQSLKATEIFEIRIHNNVFYVGTSNGLVRFEQSEQLQESGSFKNESAVRTFLILGENNWLISAFYQDSSNLSNLYKSSDQGNTWVEYNNGFGGHEKWVPETMDIDKSDSETIFARPSAFMNVARSINAGKEWESIVQSWEEPNLGTSLFVEVDSNNSDIIWAGGANALFMPSLLKSEDKGETWKGLTVLENVDAFVHDLINLNSNLVIGLSGNVPAANIIRRSKDNGATWNTVFEGAGIYTFTKSPRNPETVYASGRNSTGTLFFLASGDFGDTWQTIEFEDSPGEIQVNDMVSVMEGGKEVIYLGTNKGVYSYTFEK